VDTMGRSSLRCVKPHVQSSDDGGNGAIEPYRLIKIVSLHHHTQLTDPRRRRFVHDRYDNSDINVKVKRACVRIGQLANTSGASARSLRYYEQRGLLVASRTPTGQRVYSANDVDRARQIVRLLHAGLGTPKIAELLPCLTAPPEERTTHLLTSLLAEQDRLDNDIASLRSVRASLNQVITGIEHEHHTPIDP
jgi:DNA-binding transcriptional MerR regulator